MRVNGFVLLFTAVGNGGDSFDFFDFISGGELGRLLILYKDRSIRSNLREHRNFVSTGVIATVDLTGFSG